MSGLQILVLSILSITSFGREMEAESKSTHYLNDVEGKLSKPEGLP
jgi:hypothetical protein